MASENVTSKNQIGQDFGMIVACRHLAFVMERVVFEDCSHDYDILSNDHDDPALTSSVSARHSRLLDDLSTEIATDFADCRSVIDLDVYVSGGDATLILARRGRVSCCGVHDRPVRHDVYVGADDGSFRPSLQQCPCQRLVEVDFALWDCSSSLRKPLARVS
jgi:hypothetical protein